MENGSADKGDASNRVRLQSQSVLSNDHYTLRKAEFDFLRRDGAWQKQTRESYDIGDGAAVLPIDRAHSTVILIRQFRWPAFDRGYCGLMVEAIAGKLDGDDAETCAIREAV